MRRNIDALRTVIFRRQRRTVSLLSRLVLIALVWLVFVPDNVRAQGQSDHIGRQLGTAPKLSTTHPETDAKSNQAREPFRERMILRAGQSAVVRAGASTFTVARQAVPLSFKIGQKPACGKTWETSQGIVLETTGECAGLTLEFDYEVNVADAAVDQRNTVKVTVQAGVQSGIESCGISNAPYEFVSIPGGSYSLQNLPGPLADLAGLIGTDTAVTEPFCITEEAVPASELEGFLAEQPLAQKRASFPEALDTAPRSVFQVDTGRAVRSPALAVSYRMAAGYAERQSNLIGRSFRLPRLEQYIAAAVYLLRQEPDAPSTHSFLVSLRGGLMEWTDTPCNAASGTFILLGTKQQSGLLDKYCYERSQTVTRMSFRLVTQPSTKSSLNAR